MNIDTDVLIMFLIMWGIPTFMVARGYFKMSEEEQKEAMTDVKSPRFIFTVGFLVIGFLFAMLGDLLKIDSMEMGGNIFMAIGGIVSIIRIWKINKLGSVLLFLLLLLAIFT
ncbi:hypothetical protein CEW92_17725 [Bacillaceae bacterium SAS-127]|nr:hypothetical protein CEW92_17725 [Bacillaceae bacterium SAS-127]